MENARYPTSGELAACTARLMPFVGFTARCESRTTFSSQWISRLTNQNRTHFGTIR
jgi:hypothetical protein